MECRLSLGNWTHGCCCSLFDRYRGENEVRLSLPCELNVIRGSDVCPVVFNYWNFTNIQSYQAKPSESYHTKPSLFWLHLFVAISVVSSHYLLFLRKEGKWDSISFYSVCAGSSVDWKRMNTCNLIHQTIFKSKTYLIPSVFNAHL